MFDKPLSKREVILRGAWYIGMSTELSEAVCDWSIVGDRCRADRQSSVAVVAGEDSKSARFEVS